MSPADATAAASRAPSGSAPEAPDALARIEAALERIATATVRRAEREAELRDLQRIERRDRDQAVASSDDVEPAMAALRDRLDLLILRVRAAIEEAEG